MDFLKRSDPMHVQLPSNSTTPHLLCLGFSRGSLTPSIMPHPVVLFGSARRVGCPVLCFLCLFGMRASCAFPLFSYIYVFKKICAEKKQPDFLRPLTNHTYQFTASPTGSYLVLPLHRQILFSFSCFYPLAAFCPIIYIFYGISYSEK